MKKKVLFLVTKSNWGGAQRYVYDLATALPKEGFETVVTAGGNGLLFEKLREKNIRTISIPFMGRDISLAKEIRGLWFLLKIIQSEKPDIIHLNSPKIGGLGAVAARLCGIKKIVYTVHGFPFNEIRPVWQTFLIKIFSWLTAFLMTDNIVLSEKEKNQVINWPFLKNKISVIPLGIIPPNFLPRSEARSFLFEKARIVPDDHFTIISIGELTANKDYVTALEAVAELSFPFRYFIVGEGEEREKIGKQIQELGLSHKVHLLGFAKDACLYLKGADLFLLSSQKEGLPYVILEALSAEVPIASTNAGAISEVLGEENVSPIKNSEELKKLIEKNKNGNPPYNAGSQKEYSLQKELKELIAIYLRNKKTESC